MTMQERTGLRSLIYSAWHRPASTGALIGRVAAAKLLMIDIDSCEYCYCGRPVALIETQESTHDPKPARVMTRLALMAGIPAYSVSIHLDDDRQVTGFKVRRLDQGGSTVSSMDPGTYAWWLSGLRSLHECAAADAT
jgi:hypothetical protein